MTRSPGFPDHFSTAAPAYARFRPRYPAALFAWLTALRPPPAIAYDCGTGSGQAAVALAARGYRVVASDASVEQLRRARAHPRVAYLAAAAERLPLRTRSIGLVTVAQALHWFDIEVFFREVQRILVDDGIVAVWTYGDLRLGPPLDDAIAPTLARLLPYWPPERALVAAEYRTIPFPFRELAARHAALGTPEPHQPADLGREQVERRRICGTHVERCPSRLGHDRREHELYFMFYSATFLAPQAML